MNSSLPVITSSKYVQLTSCHIFSYSCTRNIPIHYCSNTDGVGVINNKTCNVVHVFSGVIRAILGVVVNVDPGQVVADPVLVALHWSVDPVEGNTGIERYDGVDRGWSWFCSG